MYDSAVVEEIKYRNDLQDVVSAYVTLKRAGSGLVGLCPFHSEKTPSFHVVPEKGFFHCFGCGAGGDVISFIMRMENLEYPAAIEFLAERAGIKLPENGMTEKNGVNRIRIKEMNRDAAKFFHEQLLRTPEAIAYLTERGLSGAAVKRFGLGFSPDEPHALYNHMRKLGYNDNELIAGFLCGISKRSGKPYDYFRGRIIFPVIDTAGAVIAFGGRVTDGSLPKYLNTSDTPAFQKRKNLFALNFAKNHCGEGFILCEGYMDVIALHEAGFGQAVATLGTAITPEQARIMRRYTDRVLISYDNDSAGQSAAKKAFRLLGEAGIDCRILQMTGAKDPDEYIRKFGAERFRRLCTESLTQFDYVFGNIIKKYNFNMDSERIKASSETAEYISGVLSAVEREVYIVRASEKLGISADNLRSDIERLRRLNSKKEKSDKQTELVRNTVGYGDRVNPDRIKNRSASSAEEAIIGIMLLLPEQIKYASEVLELKPEDFVTSFGRKVYEEILELYQKSDGFDWGMLSEKFNPDEMSRIAFMRQSRINLGNNGEELLKKCIDRLRLAHINDKSLEDIINEKRHGRK